MSDPQEAATPSDPHSAEALDLDAIEKRAGAATGTRYGMSATDATGTILWATADDQPFVHLGEIFPETSQGDIDFLLHARTDVPTLVAAVRLRDAEVAELREAYESWKSSGRAMHSALLEIWHSVTAWDTSDMTFGDDPQSVVKAVRESVSAEVAELKAKIAELTQEVQDADSAIAEAIVRGW